MRLDTHSNDYTGTTAERKAHMATRPLGQLVPSKAKSGVHTRGHSTRTPDDRRYVTGLPGSMSDSGETITTRL